MMLEIVKMTAFIHHLVREEGSHRSSHFMEVMLAEDWADEETEEPERDGYLQESIKHLGIQHPD